MYVSTRSVNDGLMILIVKHGAGRGCVPVDGRWMCRPVKCVCRPTGTGAWYLELVPGTRSVITMVVLAHMHTVLGLLLVPAVIMTNRFQEQMHYRPMQSRFA